MLLLLIMMMMLMTAGDDEDELLLRPYSEEDCRMQDSRCYRPTADDEGGSTKTRSINRRDRMSE